MISLMSRLLSGEQICKFSVVELYELLKKYKKLTALEICEILAELKLREVEAKNDKRTS